jgi:hypothetical protein
MLEWMQCNMKVLIVSQKGCGKGWVDLLSFCVFFFVWTVRLMGGCCVLK